MYITKVIAGLLLLICLIHKNKAQGRFEDSDRENDFISRLSDNSQQWDIRHNIPGEPDIDYPILSIVPRTSFSCDTRHEGYYADVETRCQAFRICTNTDLSGEGFAFLCPNGTLFSQRSFVCDWYRNVDCSESENYYFMNEKLGKVINSKDEMLNAVKEMIEFPIRTATKVLTQTTQSFFHTTTVRPQTKPTIGKVTTFKPLGSLPASTQAPNRINRITTTLRTTTQRSVESNRLENTNRKESNKNEAFKDSRPTTQIPITKEEAESTDLSKLVPPEKVYVSNLGELSTDVGSTFDPQTSFIIGENSKDQDVQPEIKYDIDVRFGDDSEDDIKSRALQNENLKQNTDSLRNSLPGNINDVFGSQDTFTTSSQNTQSIIQQNRFIPQPNEATNSLNLAEKINSGLNGFAKITVAGTEPNSFNNNIYSGEGRTTTQSFSNSGSPQANGRLFGLADSINSVFQKNNLVDHPANSRLEINSFQYANGEQPQRGQRLLGQEFDTQSNKPLPKFDDFRRGRQFQFQGSGFKKPGDISSSTSTQFINLNNQGQAYLPPSGRQGTLGSGYKNQNNTFETTTVYSFGTVPSLLINVEDNDNSEDTIPAHSGENHYVHVKKRAERLLLQGVHLTLYENDENDINDNSFSNNIKTRSTFIPSTSSITTTTVNPIAIDDITNPTLITSTTMKNFINNTTLATTVKSLRKTTVYSTQIPTTKEIEKPKTKLSSTLNIRRQTAKPINFTKKPSAIRDSIRTINTTTTPNKYRRRPTNKFSSKYSVHTYTVDTDPIDENDLTPQANSYGVRPNYNRIRNETKKYILPKRTKVNYENGNAVYSGVKGKSKPSSFNFNFTSTTSAPSTTSGTTKYDSNLQASLHLQTELNAEKASRNQGSTQGLTPHFENLKSLFPSQSLDNSRQGSSYVELPGTKVTIAKSQEQGHFSISNDPAHRGETSQFSSGSNVYQPLDEFFKHTFVNGQIKQEQGQQAVHQQLNYQQPTHYKTNQQQQSTNYFLPFPTISTTKKSIQSTGFEAFPSLSQIKPNNLNQFYQTTQHPYIVPQNSYYQGKNIPNNELSFENQSGGTKFERNQFSTFPNLERVPISQRRLDVADDEKEEGTLYTGVSSYHVPISSVGRLAGDVLALRKKRDSF